MCDTAEPPRCSLCDTAQPPRCSIYDTTESLRCICDTAEPMWPVEGWGH